MNNKLSQNIVEGPQGLFMPEATARKIEEMGRSIPRDFVYRRIARKSDEFQFDPGERTDVSVITTDALDRDGEVVLPAGIDWSGYNRVVTFCHRYDQLPVGSNWWIRARGAEGGRGSLIAKTHYPQKPGDWGDAPWLPSAVLHLMQQPVPTCTGKSIGFLPLNIREATAEERARRPELAGVPIIDKAAGIEYAVAPLPANPEAQMEAVAKGREAGLIDDELEALFSPASPLRETPPPRIKSVATVNEHAYSVARSLIVAGDVDESGAWSFDAKDEDAILGPNQDWHRYSGCFLGTDPSADPHSKAHYHYPFTKLVAGKLTLFRHALDSIRVRSSQQSETAIFEAAGKLLDLLDSHGKAIHFVRPITVRRAIEREILPLRPAIRRQIHDHIRDVFCAATGRVS